MSLKLYHQKRDFKKTNEPKGKVINTKKKNLYVIQKHAASHLHYDFRLELKGVLLSWAIPKGPSLDPNVKRLAMHVEDHPVEYGSFEGIIPKGQYGGGTVMLWDKGSWVCEDKDPSAAYQKGNLTFFLTAKKLNGKWKLIRMNKDDKTWLLIKIKDDFAKSIKNYDITQEEPNSILTQQSIEEIEKNYKNIWGKKGLVEKKNNKKNKPFYFEKVKKNLSPKKFPKIIHPQLATLVDKPPEGKNWLYEIKFDGYRLIAFKQGLNTKLFTRNNNDWTDKFPMLAKEINKLSSKNLILDGEVVVLDKHNQSNFQLLQNAIQENHATFIYYLFDILYFDEFNLMTLPLLDRKNILKELMGLNKNKIIKYSDHIFGTGEEVLKNACKLGLEGIISKEIHSVYSERRDKTWLKIKCTKRQEFIIGGFLKSSKRPYFRSLMLGTFNKKGELDYHGNVGTGFTEASIKNIHHLLLKQVSTKNPFSTRPKGSKNATWLNPVIIAEIDFTEWTEAGTLRHPSFKGIRNDKNPKSVIREKIISVKRVITKPTKKLVKSTPKDDIMDELTNPNKILYPEDNITKADIANYYDEIQEWILPYIVNRPLTLVRCPNNYYQCFYQKHIAQKMPEGLYGIMIKEKKGRDKYIYLKDAEGLIALTQLGVLELHPWGSHIETLECPDTIVFDLDPSPEIPWIRIVKAAFEIKDLLKDLSLKSFVKSTGGKGLHVVIPIKPEFSWDQVKNFSHELVNYMINQNSKEYIGKMTKSERKNKIYLDYLRNQRGATSIAPYSLRARKHAPVATPLDWQELTKNVNDTSFTMESVKTRLRKLKKDPWADFLKVKQSLKLNKIR